jgi:endonuclease-3
MRTSRIASQTSKLVAALLPSKKRTTRSSLASNASTSRVTSPKVVKVKKEVKEEFEEELGERNDSELSSANPNPILDIEDIAGTTSSRKRKRGVDTATTSTATVTRTSPRKAFKAEGGKIKAPKRAPAKKVVNEDGAVIIHPPLNWEEVYAEVTEMRKHVIAPVDTMGCENIAEDHLDDRTRRFQTLIALMLSAQTKDTTNAQAMKQLQTELPGGLNLESILEVDPVRLNELIYIVGFHNNKTRYIKATAEILRDQFDGDIPDTVEGLMSLPGVGPKMAYLCLSSAWGRTEGIGVDVHVHRITNLWRWHKTKGPEETRLALEAWLPQEKWHDINHVLVGFGQTICLPVGRHCEDCTLSAKKLCPSAVVSSKRSIKRVKKEVAKQEEGEEVKLEVEHGVVVKEEEVAGDT